MLGVVVRLGDRRAIACLCLVVQCAMAACSRAGDTAHVPEPVHTDSAGIEIVVNSITATLAPVFATLDSLPSLRLGSLDGYPEEQFGAVSDVLPLPRRGVAVLDGQAAQVRVFGSDGRYQSTLGSKGEGPGEFQSPIALGLLTGDTLAVYDAGSRRITQFSPDGTLGRITTLENTRAKIVMAAFLPDGRLIGQSRWLAPGGGPLPGSELTFARDTAVLTVFTTHGTVEDTLDVVPGREMLTSIQRKEGSISVWRRPPAFGRANMFAVSSDGIWSSTNDRFELRLRGVEDGRLLRIVRAPGLNRSVTPELTQGIYDQAMGEVETPEDRSRVDTWFALSPRPDTQPAYDALVVDDLARLWVREWSALGVGRRWWVFDSGGELLGSVDVPSGLTITSVRCGWAWGVERDELDVDYVVRYALWGVDGC